MRGVPKILPGGPQRTLLVKPKAERVLAGKDPGINVQGVDIIIGPALKGATSAVGGCGARAHMAPPGWQGLCLGGSLCGLKAALTTCSVATVRWRKALIRAKKLTCVRVSQGYSGYSGERFCGCRCLETVIELPLL